MKLLYYRIYYTIYRSLIWGGQSHETDMIRFNALFIQSLFTMFIAVGSVGVLIAIIGKSIIFNSKLQSVIFLLSIFVANAYMIFYKNRYKEIESSLSPTDMAWQSHETDMIRVNFFILLSLSTMLTVVGMITFLIGITGEVFIINSKIQGVVLVLLIVAVNAYIIFYRKKYKEIESELSLIWIKDKSKNILLTVAFLCLSIIYTKEHPLKEIKYFSNK